MDSSLFLCWSRGIQIKPDQALITSSLRLTSSQSMQPLPIARMNTGICHFSSQKPFITHYNRGGKCETPASVPQCNTSGVISYYSWLSIRVNKDMASQFCSIQTPAALPILFLQPEMTGLCHVCAKKGWYSLSRFEGIYKLITPYLIEKCLPLLPSMRPFL